MVLAAGPLGLWLRGAGRGLFCPIFPSHLHFQPLCGLLCLALAAEDGSTRPEPAQGCQDHAAIAPAASFCQAEVLGPLGTGALMKQNQSLPCLLLSPALLPNSQQGSSTSVLLGLNLSRAVFNHLSH